MQRLDGEKIGEGTLGKVELECIAREGERKIENSHDGGLLLVLCAYSINHSFNHSIIQSFNQSTTYINTTDFNHTTSRLLQSIANQSSSLGFSLCLNDSSLDIILLDKFNKNI